MNPSVKVFSILSLSAAVGKILSETKGDGRIIYRGQKLYEAGLNATGAYPFPALKKSKVKQIERKVDDVCAHGQDINIIETLSFLIIGLTDIRSKVNVRNWFYLDPVLKRVQWCMDLFTGKYSNEDIHESAYAKYEAWVK